MFLLGTYLIEPLEKRIDYPTIEKVFVNEVPLFIYTQVTDKNVFV